MPSALSGESENSIVSDVKSPSLEHLYNTARRALLVGGDVLRRGFGQRNRISYKSAVSPVTQVDQLSERKIIRLILNRFPDHTFMAEESAFVKKGDLGKSRPDRYRWVIDPLDGTINYIHGIPQSCVSVAVERGGEILAGGVYDPFRRELFMAVKGKGATMNGSKIRVSRERKMIRSLLITGFPYDRRTHGDKYLSLLRPFLKKSGGVRRFGAAAIDLAWVACGRAEGFWEMRLQPWDVAGGKLLIEEAGGRVSNFHNKPLDLDSPIQTVASNGLIHKHLTRVLSRQAAFRGS